MKSKHDLSAIVIKIGFAAQTKGALLKFSTCMVNTLQVTTTDIKTDSTIVIEQISLKRTRQ